MGISLERLTELKTTYLTPDGLGLKVPFPQFKENTVPEERVALWIEIQKQKKAIRQRAGIDPSVPPPPPPLSSLPPLPIENNATPTAAAKLFIEMRREQQRHQAEQAATRPVSTPCGM